MEARDNSKFCREKEEEEEEKRAAKISLTFMYMWAHDLNWVRWSYTTTNTHYAHFLRARKKKKKTQRGEEEEEEALRAIGKKKETQVV